MTFRAPAAGPLAVRLRRTIFAGPGFVWPDLTCLRMVLAGGLHWLSAPARTVVEALAECDGRVVAADLLAARAGLKSRHQLARLFHREGLPPIEETAAWTHLLHWVLQWEGERVSLCRSALRSGRDPAVCYRTVRRLTAHTWREVRALGSGWVLLRLLDRCRRDVRQKQAAPASRPPRIAAGPA